jgi:hypothetical protein
MRILGLTFAGTATERRVEMSRFVRDTLSLTEAPVDGAEADFFALPDGSIFAVSPPGGMGQTRRSVGFLVDDLDAAVATLRSAGVKVGEVNQNARERYVHFWAPDQQLYELVEPAASRLSGR